MTAKKEKSIISRRIKELRDERNHTQQNLADILMISKVSVSKIEQDLITLTLENAVKIADYYNVSVDWLTGRIEERNNPLETLDVLSKYVGYTSRDQFSFEKKKSKDDDPFVSLTIDPDLHEYLMGNAKAENILKYDDLPNGQEFYEAYVKGTRQKFLDELNLFEKNTRWIIPLVEEAHLKKKE